MEYQEYSRRLPEDAAAHNDLGYTYYRLRRFDEAVSEYETSLKLNPKAGLAYYNLALVYYAEGDKTNALDACLKAVANGYSGDPKFIAALHASETK
jgi:Flp pilus assembly protein TadD